jgi:predicted nucleotidyltransferase component of viral defense system
MLSRGEIEEYARVTNLNIGQTEKDLLQHHVLSALGRFTRSDLVFKGGTCLHKIYGLDRFSEDLDFTAVRKFDNINSIERAGRDLSILGYKTNIRKAGKRGGRGAIRLLIEGPLFDGRDMSICSITISISTRGDLIKSPVTKKIVPVYPEVQPYVVSHMDIEEILAEKVRALLTRNKARDLYDLFFIRKRKIKPDKTMILSKLSYYDLKPKSSDLRKAVKSKRVLWSKELRPLLHGEIPKFEEVKKIVLKYIDVL